MPISRRRKKKGKPVGNGESKNRAAHEDRMETMKSGVTLQDLINAVAFQEHQKGNKVADDAVVNIPEVIPVTVGEGDEKREIGTAVHTPGEEIVDITITDPQASEIIAGPMGNYSIDKETEDGGQ